MLKTFYLITLALLIYVLFLMYSIYQTTHIAEKIILTTIPFEQHPAHPSMYILVAGDSTAVGVGSVDPKDSVAGRLGRQFPHADVTNLGVSGARLNDLLLTLKEHGEKHYDLILLQIGGNDVTHFTSYALVRKELSEILNFSTKHASKTILLTAGNIGAAPVFYWPLSSLIKERTLGVREIFMDEAAKHKTVSYIDLFKDLKDDPFEKDIKRYYAPDSFHLTGDGYGIWYLSVQKAL